MTVELEEEAVPGWGPLRRRAQTFHIGSGAISWPVQPVQLPCHPVRIMDLRS
jgi:hypothetical protein